MTLFDIMAQEAGIAGDSLTGVDKWWRQASQSAKEELMNRVNNRTYPSYHPVAAIGTYIKMFLPKEK